MDADTPTRAAIQSLPDLIDALQQCEEFLFSHTDEWEALRLYRIVTTALRAALGANPDFHQANPKG